MASADVDVRIDTAALDRLTMPGIGMVSRKIHRISEEVATLARVYSPKRTGTMSRNINTSPGFFNHSKCSYRVSVDVPYASYVIKGTVGPIHGGLRRDEGGRFSGRGVDKRGRALPNRKLLPVGKSQGGPITYRRSVSGQTANDFLGRARDEVLDRYKL